MTTVKHIPILFNGEMVRAILDDRKTLRKLYVRKGEDPNAPQHLARRLANGTTINESTGCWEWQRHRNNYGYGKLTVAGRGVYAHRLAYELCNSPIPGGMDLLHRCDNPRCINPDHLSVGTRSDNMKDCSRKGRARIPMPVLRGTANGAAKLSETDVVAIRRLLAKKWTQQAIADRFGVPQSQISNIKRGRGWA
jgi:hypothetical protein